MNRISQIRSWAIVLGLGVFPSLARAEARWGPPSVGVVRAWAYGETWGSFSGEFPGYLNQLVRDITMNRLIPNLEFEQLAVTTALLIAVVVSLRFRTYRAYAAGALLVASTVWLLPNVQEPFRAHRCLELRSSYNYVVGACGQGPFPYLPRHVRYPVLSAVGTMSGIAAIALLVIGVSDKQLRQRAREPVSRP